MISTVPDLGVVLSYLGGFPRELPVTALLEIATFLMYEEI